MKKIKEEEGTVNSQQAKQIDLPDLLSRLGYEPVKITKSGRELWYPSPFRQERTASFHTSFLGGKWIWKDFGDAGGNVIDFVMRHETVPFKEALAFLRNMYQGSLFEPHNHKTKLPDVLSFSTAAEPQASMRELEFLEASSIKNPVIFEYLEKERKIPGGLANRYLQEVTYRNIPKDKTFFAFGMKNASGGYEIRSASDQYPFKSALIKRDITVIRGRGSTSVSVFEGMTDFLSLLVLQNLEQLKDDAIVMHSVSTYKRTVQFIKEQGYEKVFTFLDNDKTGKKYTAKFEQDLESLNVISQSQTFRPHKDLNDALVARKIIPQTEKLTLLKFGR